MRGLWRELNLRLQDYRWIPFPGLEVETSTVEHEDGRLDTGLRSMRVWRGSVLMVHQTFGELRRSGMMGLASLMLDLVVVPGFLGQVFPCRS